MRDLKPTQSGTVLCVALLFSACGGEQHTAPGAPTAPTGPTGQTFTLSGVITDSVSGRPIPGAYLAGIAPDPTTCCRGGWPPDGLTLEPADPTGHYKISGLPDLLRTAWVAVYANGYLQQCAARATMHGDTSLDIAVTPLANLAVEPSPTTTATAGSRTVSGVVYEVTPEGRRPVENASVGWDIWYGDYLVADTRSDAAGRYLLCGLPQGHIDGLEAAKQGYQNQVNNVSVNPGTDAVVDIEMIKQK
jgi:hypothetical protein